MRIDKFTEIFSLKGKSFLHNSRTGVVDEVGNDLAREITNLKIGSSFTPVECNLKEPLINELIERGYITYFSNEEEIDEIKWFVEKSKEKVKKEKKTAALVLDTFVCNNWCFSDGITGNTIMNKFKFTNLLKIIIANKFADTIDLWLLIKKRESDWDWIIEQADKNNLKIKSVFTIVKNETELKEIADWYEKTVSLNGTVNIKYESEKFEYLSLSKSNSKIISKKKTVFINHHPFFCPFIYKTCFIDAVGRISYCVKRLTKENSVGKIDIKNRRIVFQNGWSDKLFNSFCDKATDCIYSIYCSKLCLYLGEFYNKQKNNNECGIIPAMNLIIEKKIRNLW